MNAAGRSGSIIAAMDASDAFYRANGKANAIRTCNAVVANWLRLAGVRTSLWPPFVDGLTWRYRKTSPHL